MSSENPSPCSGGSDSAETEPAHTTRSTPSTLKVEDEPQSPAAISAEPGELLEPLISALAGHSYALLSRVAARASHTNPSGSE